MEKGDKWHNKTSYNMSSTFLCYLILKKERATIFITCQTFQQNHYWIELCSPVLEPRSLNWETSKVFLLSSPESSNTRPLNRCYSETARPCQRGWPGLEIMSIITTKTTSYLHIDLQDIQRRNSKMGCPSTEHSSKRAKAIIPRWKLLAKPSPFNLSHPSSCSGFLLPPTPHFCSAASLSAFSETLQWIRLKFFVFERKTSLPLRTEIRKKMLVTKEIRSPVGT